MDRPMTVKIRHYYRALFREGLRAVQFTVPARFTVRDQMRAAFRGKDAIFDEVVAQRTIMFLHAAARERGLEHKIVKNLVRVARARSPGRVWRIESRKGEQENKALIQATKQFDAASFNHFDMTLAMLNKSMGLGLRCGPTFATK